MNEYTWWEENGTGARFADVEEDFRTASAEAVRKAKLEARVAELERKADELSERVEYLEDVVRMLVSILHEGGK